MMFIPNYLPCKKIDLCKLPENVEGMFIEITVRNTKWLIVLGHNPCKENTPYFLGHISKGLDMVLANYENFLILGDFNSKVSEIHMKEFCELYDLEDLINVPTCFKNPNNPSSIDVMLTNNPSSIDVMLTNNPSSIDVMLTNNPSSIDVMLTNNPSSIDAMLTNNPSSIDVMLTNNPSSIDVMLTNKKQSFCNSIAIETGLSDCHKMTVTVLKRYIKKQKPRYISYRCYKNFQEGNFRCDLLNYLDTLNDQNITYDGFMNCFTKAINQHAPLKKKLVRGNQAPFITKILSKAIMRRSKLKNRYNKWPTEENERMYKKQRNYCSNLLTKEKKKYFTNLDMKIFEDNKTFWQQVKPLFSVKKSKLQSNIVIIEDGVVYTENNEVAEKLNNFFVEAVNNLDIEPFTTVNEDHISSENVSEIVKNYEFHPSIIKIKENVEIKEKFKFINVNPEIIKDEIDKLNPKKLVLVMIYQLNF